MDRLVRFEPRYAGFLTVTRQRQRRDDRSECTLPIAIRLADIGVMI